MKKGLLIAIFIWPVFLFAQNFNHPGTLHSQDDLDRMKEKVAEQAEPWFSTWQKLIDGPHANLNWIPHPLESVCRGCPAGTSDNYIGMARDIGAAYGCALRWHITGDKAYADKAVSIMNVWGSTLNLVYGNSNSALARGAYGYEWACTGDLMYNYEGWDPTDKLVFKKMLTEVFLPGIMEFLDGHYGKQDSHYRCNWEGFNLSAVMAIGIFADSTELVNYVVDYYKNGAGNGNIHHAVNYVHEGGIGQWEESGRDQAHTANGIALLGYVCQMAWNQGIDLYGYDDNRLLKGMEYVAKYNLYNNVPYKSHAFWVDYDVDWPIYSNVEHVVSPGARGHTGPFWEVGYNHYVHVKGLEAPYLERQASLIRPVGGAGYWGGNSGGYDHLGYGSLTYAQEALGINTQTITFSHVPELKKGELYTPDATSTSGNTVYFSSSNTDVIDIIDNIFYARAPGVATITAWCNGNSAYNTAEDVSQTITVTETDILTFTGKYTVSTDGWYMIEAGQSEGSKVSLNYNRYGYPRVRQNQWWNINPIPQHWYIRRINGNDFKIVNVAYETALSVSGGSTDNNSRVILRSYTGAPDQIWTIASDGVYYSFTNKASGKVLSLVKDINADGTFLEIRSDLGSTSQRFLIKEEASGLLEQGDWGGWYDAMLEPGRLKQWNDQIITFNEMPVKNIGDANFIPNAKTSSGLKLKFSSSDTTVAEVIADTIIKVKAEGVTYITASQDGDTVTNSALPVNRLLEVISNKTDMIAYYRFEQNAMDASGNNNHGNLENNAKYDNGKKGYAVTLNGTDQCVSLPSGILQDVNDMTISTWIKLKSTTGVERVIDFEKDETAGLYLEYDFDEDSIRFSMVNGAVNQSVSVKQPISINDWTHFAITLAADTCTLFVNGIKVGRNTAMTINPSDIGATVSNLLGCSQKVDSWLNGAIDDLRIYDITLDAGQIDEMVNGQVPQITSEIAVVDTARSAFYFKVTATHSPTKFEASGLPLGLKLNSVTGAIVGKPIMAGTYQVILTASNYYGTGSKEVTITIAPADNGGLIIHYPFDQSANDLSGFEYHGAMVNGPTYSTGKINKAVMLDGKDDHITLPSGILSGIEDMTICTWVKLDAVSKWCRIFDFGTGTSVNMFLTPNSGDGTLRFAIKNGGSEQQINVSQPLSTGVWIHVAVTLAGNTGKIYVDGVLKATSTSIRIDPVDLGVTPQNYIGKSQWPDPYLVGMVDDFRIYDKALSISEIQEIFAPKPESVTVTFFVDSGTEIPDIVVDINNLIEQPSDPVKEGYKFDGWYKEKEYLNIWNFEQDKVSENITLYAKWTMITSNMITLDSDVPVRIYPNPTDGPFSIELNGNVANRYEVFNVQGVLLLSGKIIDNSTLVDLKGISPGLHIVKIIGESYIVTRRVLKK